MNIWLIRKKCQPIHRYAKANNTYMKDYDNLIIIFNLVIFVISSLLGC